MYIQLTATYVEAKTSSRDVSAMETEGMSRAQVNKLKNDVWTGKLNE